MVLKKISNIKQNKNKFKRLKFLKIKIKKLKILLKQDNKKLNMLSNLFKKYSLFQTEFVLQTLVLDCCYHKTLKLSTSFSSLNQYKVYKVKQTKLRFLLRKKYLVFKQILKEYYKQMPLIKKAKLFFVKNFGFFVRLTFLSISGISCFLGMYMAFPYYIRPPFVYIYLNTFYGAYDAFQVAFSRRRHIRNIRVSSIFCSFLGPLKSLDYYFI
jgi:hypothetical protein